MQDRSDNDLFCILFIKERTAQFFALLMFFLLFFMLERDIKELQKLKQTHRHLMNYAIVQRLNFCSFTQWW